MQLASLYARLCALGSMFVVGGAVFNRDLRYYRHTNILGCRRKAVHIDTRCFCIDSIESTVAKLEK